MGVVLRSLCVKGCFVAIKGFDSKIKRLSFMTVHEDYCGPTNYIYTASDRLDRGMNSGLCRESPDVTSCVECSNTLVRHCMYNCHRSGGDRFILSLQKHYYPCADAAKTHETKLLIRTQLYH